MHGLAKTFRQYGNNQWLPILSFLPHIISCWRPYYAGRSPSFLLTAVLCTLICTHSSGSHQVSLDGFRFLTSTNHTAVTFLEHATVCMFPSVIVGKFPGVESPGRGVSAFPTLLAVAVFFTKGAAANTHPLVLYVPTLQDFKLFENLWKSWSASFLFS